MGFLHVYTGNGKGKTTCAVGLAVRAIGAGERVAFLQFDKGFDPEHSEHYSERAVLRHFPKLDLLAFGAERMMTDGLFRFENRRVDFEQAQAGLAKAREIICDQKHFLVVCDELITCVRTGLLEKTDLMELVEIFKLDGGTQDLVLTGRGAFPELIVAADLVTEMVCLKHYYEQKVPARCGIDF